MICKVRWEDNNSSKNKIKKYQKIEFIDIELLSSHILRL